MCAGVLPPLSSPSANRFWSAIDQVLARPASSHSSRRHSVHTFLPLPAKEDVAI